MPLEPRIHNLHHNASEHTPPRWLFFDTETLASSDGAGGEVHRMRLWAAHLAERNGPTRKRGRPDTFTGTTAGQLADAVESACRGGERLWVCAHNLGFDLAVTALPVVLVERGWEVTQHAVTGGSPWLRLRRHRASVTMVDSFSWLPVPLAELGERLGIVKPPLPDWDDSSEAWFARCRADVAILEAAILQLLGWWDAEALGHWSLTGPGSGFNSYRHRGFAAPVVIDPDPAARELERASIYAGRAEAFRVGEQPAGLYAVLDFAHAFGSVCAELMLPRRRGVPFASLPVDSRTIGSRIGGVLAEVELEVTEPRYPLRTRRGICHPVGRFVTVLAGPEIVEARERGELRAIGRGYRYLLEPHMSDWARWAVGIVEGGEEVAPATARIAVKAWTRTVPGRWAGRTSRVEWETPTPMPGWRMEPAVGHPGGARGSILEMGGRRYWIANDVEMDSSFPAVLAWVQSHLRVRLSRLIDALGPDCVVSCNTDGVIVDVARLAWGRARRRMTVEREHEALGWLLTVMRQADARLWPLYCQVKEVAHTLEVLSPQHLVIGRRRHLSGVPRNASALGGHRYRFTDWPRLGSHLEGGGGAGYRRRERTVNLSAVPVLRWVLRDGRTVPVTASGRLGGVTTLDPWLPGRHGPEDGVLAASQHPLLAPLVGAELLAAG